ncbi:hypothetical protein HDU78_000479 [Chytriomyces hyalinus]|nr:hypothetical protein HDU78_000479 [Chytriomyces hyalinus]
MAITPTYAYANAVFTPKHNSLVKPAPTQTLRVSVPPALAAMVAQSAFAGKYLYDGLSGEDKARVAIINAFTNSTAKFLDEYQIIRIVGFGSNGVVLAARNSRGDGVAVKIVYKEKVSTKVARSPSEIEVLQHLSEEPSEYLLNMAEHWEDAYHHYLVTDLFGSDWFQSTDAVSESMKPLVFKTRDSTRTQVHEYLFSAGSSDLWSWQHAHRSFMVASEGHGLLPLEPVRQLVKQAGLGLQSMHSRGFYHGDVKVENILVQSGLRVKMADFGHSKHASLGIAHYGTAELQGPEFMADTPFAQGHVDGRASDVFALGMVLYMLLSEDGRLPKTVYDTNAGYESLLASAAGCYPFEALADVDSSDQVWSLLNGMCRVDPAQRLTIDQVLSHPWFA